MTVLNDSCCKKSGRYQLWPEGGATYTRAKMVLFNEEENSGGLQLTDKLG